MNIATILAQSHPANTTAVSAYSPAVGVSVQITRVVICNTTGSGATFRIFLDNDGTTYDETTALFFDETLAANTSRLIEAEWWLDNSDGNLAVRTDTNSALTFTFFGAENSR